MSRADSSNDGGGRARRGLRQRAGLDHRDERVRAGFNHYTIQDDGEVSPGEAWVLDPATLEFERRELPAA